MVTSPCMPLISLLWETVAKPGRRSLHTRLQKLLQRSQRPIGKDNFVNQDCKQIRLPSFMLQSHLLPSLNPIVWSYILTHEFGLPLLHQISKEIQFSKNHNEHVKLCLPSKIKDYAEVLLCCLETCTVISNLYCRPCDRHILISVTCVTNVFCMARPGQFAKKK